MLHDADVRDDSPTESFNLSYGSKGPVKVMQQGENS